MAIEVRYLFLAPKLLFCRSKRSKALTGRGRKKDKGKLKLGEREVGEWEVGEQVFGERDIGEVQVELTDIVERKGNVFGAENPMYK